MSQYVNDAEERYHYLYKHIETETKRGWPRQENIQSVINKDDLGHLKTKKYYSGSVNKYLLNGKMRGDFPLAIYYWFHVYCDDKNFAEEIDTKIIQEFKNWRPKDVEAIQKKLNAFKHLVNPNSSQDETVLVENLSQNDPHLKNSSS